MASNCIIHDVSVWALCSNPGVPIFLCRTWIHDMGPFCLDICYDIVSPKKVEVHGIVRL